MLTVTPDRIEAIALRSPRFAHTIATRWLDERDPATGAPAAPIEFAQVQRIRDRCALAMAMAAERWLEDLRDALLSPDPDAALADLVSFHAGDSA